MRQRDWDRLFKKSPSTALIIFGIMLLFFGIFSVCVSVLSLQGFGIILIIVGVALIIAGIAVSVIRKKDQQERENNILQSNIQEVDAMSGIQFEEFLAALFKKNGYSVKLTKKSGDYGVDLILTDNETSQKIIVQVKRYSKKVPISAIQEISAARQFYGIENAWVVTNNYFTQPAVNLAESNGIDLVDRNKLAEYIVNTDKINSQNYLQND